MKPHIYMAANELTSPKFCEAMKLGIPGAKIIQGDEYQPGPWVGFGSPQIWGSLTAAIKAGEDFFYGDHAYFGRGRFYRVTKNRFQHRGRGTPNFDRLKPFWEKEKPWNKAGRHIVVCPQSDNHHQRFGEPQWQQRIVKTLKLYTDRKIIVRTKRDTRPLQADLIGAWCVVTHTSNAAVEAILHGIPAICTGDCAASIMSLSDPANIEKPFYPDGRLEWAAVLANNQWNLHEMRTGKAWRGAQEQ